MKLVIEIPKEFEVDFSKDKFYECFERVKADLDCLKDKALCGRYEKETVEMLKIALSNATVCTDETAKIVYVDWKDRQFEPEIVGVYKNEKKGYVEREEKERELEAEGYDTDEEVRVWIQDVEITN